MVLLKGSEKAEKKTSVRFGASDCVAGETLADILVWNLDWVRLLMSSWVMGCQCEGEVYGVDRRFVWGGGADKVWLCGFGR